MPRKLEHGQRVRRRLGSGACVAALLAASVPLTSCGLFYPGRNADPKLGRLAVVFTNTGDALVYVLLGATPANPPAQQWLVPVAPHGWNSLALACDLQQVVPIATLVAGTDADPNGLTIPFTDAALKLGADYACGGVIAVQVAPGRPATARRPVLTTMSVARRISDAASQASADNGFVVVELRAPAGVSAEITVSWEDQSTRVYESTLSLSGAESRLGFFVNCPLRQFAVGRLSDPNAPIGTVADQTLPGPMAPLENVPCGSVVVVQLSPADSTPAGYALALQPDDGSSAALLQTFADMRAVLQAAGVAEQPTNALQLFPAPAVPTTQP